MTLALGVVNEESFARRVEPAAIKAARKRGFVVSANDWLVNKAEAVFIKGSLKAIVRRESHKVGESCRTS